MVSTAYRTHSFDKLKSGLSWSIDDEFLIGSSGAFSRNGGIDPWGMGVQAVRLYRMEVL